MNPDAVLIVVFACLGYIGVSTLIVVGWQVWSFRWVWVDGYFKVIFYDGSKHMFPKLMKLGVDKSFRYKIGKTAHRYVIDPDTIYTMGRFKQRVLHYVIGDALPKAPTAIELMGPGEKNRSSVEFEKVAGNRITEQLLTVFKRSAISPTMALLILLVVMVVGFIGVGGYVGMKIENAHAPVAPVAPVRTVPEILR